MDQMRKDIKDALKRRGWSVSKLATEAGVERTSLQRQIRGDRRFNEDSLKRVSRALRVQLVTGGPNIDHVGGEEGPLAIPTGNYLPLLSLEACCGPFKEAWDEVIDWLPVPPDLYSEDRYFLKAAGDSMSPDIEDREYVIVDRKLMPQNGDICVACCNDEVTIKKHFRYEDYILLQPSNDKYKPMIISHDSGLVVETRGVVISVQKILKRQG